MGKRHRRPAHPRFTLTQIEDHDWGPPTYDSHLVTKIHALRYKPIGEFSVEDLRICLGQKMSVDILLPLALEHVERDPLVSGDYYEGDLLQNVVHCMDCWPEDPQLRARLVGVLTRGLEVLATQPEWMSDVLNAKLSTELCVALEALTPAD